MRTINLLYILLFLVLGCSPEEITVEAPCDCQKVYYEFKQWAENGTLKFEKVEISKEDVICQEEQDNGLFYIKCN